MSYPLTGHFLSPSAVAFPRPPWISWTGSSRWTLPSACLPLRHSTTRSSSQWTRTRSLLHSECRLCTLLGHIYRWLHVIIGGVAVVYGSCHGYCDKFACTLFLQSLPLYLSLLPFPPSSLPSFLPFLLPSCPSLSFFPFLPLLPPSFLPSLSFLPPDSQRIRTAMKCGVSRDGKRKTH